MQAESACFCTMQQLAMQTQFPLQDVLHFAFVYHRSNAKRKLTTLQILFFAKARIKEKKNNFSLFLVLHLSLTLVPSDFSEDYENHSWERCPGCRRLFFSGEEASKKAVPLAPGASFTWYFYPWYNLPVMFLCRNNIVFPVKARLVPSVLF